MVFRMGEETGAHMGQSPSQDDDLFPIACPLHIAESVFSHLNSTPCQKKPLLFIAEVACWFNYKPEITPSCAITKWQTYFNAKRRGEWRGVDGRQGVYANFMKPPIVRILARWLAINITFRVVWV